MYHVFYVNDGYMLALDVAPVGHFRDLCNEILLKTGVPPKDQVFFLGGGEALIGDYLLSAYSDAGTDTNPVYFIKRVTHEKDPINSREEEGINNLFENWKREVEKLNQQQARSALVTQYIDLGVEGLRVAETLIRFCGKIVSEHQYLNQGWTAVTRNLDENVSQLSSRYTKAAKIAAKFPTIRKRAKYWICDFEKVFDALSKIHVSSYLLSNSVSSSSGASSPQSTVNLYEWISSQDQDFTLEELVEHVSEHIDKLDDVNLSKAGTALKGVKDLMKRTDYREIRGIDKRLATLDAKLADLESNLYKLKDMYGDHIINVQPDANNYRVLLSEQKDKVNKLFAQMEEFTKHAHLFLTSKMELLKNVRQRLAGWIRQGYDRLQVSNTDLIVFEKKFNGFRSRLDLIRQIREAPLIFIACVTEVIRRHSFKSEFDHWFMQFSQKAAELIREENTIRAEFYVKLEKHFLREIFRGMSDELPNFCPQRQKFDMNLPALGPGDLRTLRDSLKEYVDNLDLFKVIAPQVFSRLAVEDPSNPRTSHPNLHREESFFTRDQARNLRDADGRYPSTNWLNEEAQVEMSPSTQSFLSRTLGSTTSLNAAESQVTTPSDLVPLDQIHLMRKDSMPRQSMVGTPSSVDLACPQSIHPDRHPKHSSPMKIRRTSRNSFTSMSLERDYPKPIFEEGVPVESPEDEDVFVSGKGFERRTESNTPLYTPLISPVRHLLVDKECQTLEEQPPDPSTPVHSECQVDPILTTSQTAQTSFLAVNSTDTQVSVHVSHQEVQHSIVMAEQHVQTDEPEPETPESSSDFEVVKTVTVALGQVQELANVVNEMKTECQSENANLLSSLQKSLNETIERFTELQQTQSEEHRRELESMNKRWKEDFDQVNNKLEESLAENKKLQEIVEHEKYLRKEKEGEVHEKSERLRDLNAELLNTIKAKEESQADVVRLTSENSKLENRLDSDDTCMNIELEVFSELLKRELEEDEVNWVKQEIEKRRNIKVCMESSSPMNESALKQEYENAYKNKMSLLLKGVEDRKNAEMAKMKEELEREMIEENDQLLNRMKQRINELERRVQLYDQVSSPVPPISESSAQLTDSVMAQSCMVIEEDEEAVHSYTKSASTSTEESAEKKGEPEATEESDRKPDEGPRPDVSTINVSSQTKLKLVDMRLMISLHEVSEGSGVLLVFNDQYKTFMVFSVTGSLYFVKQRGLKRLGIDQNQAPKFTLLFAKVISVELCETKKAPNRYNLPANTRFYRVDVMPMPSSMGGLALQIAASRPSSSKEEESRPDP